MFKNVEKSKKDDHTQKKDKQLNQDSYINDLSKKSSNENWWQDKKAVSEEKIKKEREESKKFLKNDSKISSRLPDEEENEKKVNKKTPDRFGFFETEEGTVEVGYKRNNKNTNISFSLISDIENREEGIPDESPYDKDNYFGKMYKGDEKKFRAGKISFEYNPRNDSIRKIEDDDNNSSNDDEELIYDMDKGEEKIDDLEERKNDFKDNKKIKEELNFTKTIHKEKEEKNQKFLKEIKKFISYFGKDKLNKIIASEDEISRRKRILSLSSQSLEIVMMKRMIRKLLKEHYGDKIDNEIISMILMNLSSEEIKILFELLKNQENIEFTKFD